MHIKYCYGYCIICIASLVLYYWLQKIEIIMNMVVVVFLLIVFTAMSALQTMQFKQILKHRDHRVDSDVTQNLVNTAIKCVKKCATAECNLQFRFITFDDYDGILINFTNLTLQDVLKVNSNYIMNQNPIAVIGINCVCNVSFSSKLSINSLLSLFCLSLSVCYCNNVTCNNNTLVVMIALNTISMCHQNQTVHCICGSENVTFTANITVHLNDSRNGINNLHGCKHTRTGPRVSRPPSLRVKRSQEDNTLIDCPLGFKAFHNECDCDPKLMSALPLIECSNPQLVRPAMTWIGCEKNCTQIIYSKNCFIDYCLLTASYIELNTSRINVQCNYGRTGHICGHCPKGYDLVLGANPKCTKCTNVWLLLIPLFAIAGFLLVILLFIFDFLTVTRGLINGFVLYTNIVGMQNIIIFPTNHKLLLPILVDMSNLDLGIETCFYKGMTDFDKQWLQLVFPIYLICIVGLIAIASRYSGRIEKLTRKRVISVLATLLFLSYNKLVLTTTTVLFYYQPVYHLETNTYDLFWPIDTSITLFDTKFISLFVVCLIIFLVYLIPINVILLFPTYCFQFKRVAYFKPFIDAFQAPYKDKFRYSIGIELLIRIITCICNAMYVIEYYQKFGANVAVYLVYFSYITMVQPYKVFSKTVLHWSFVLNIGFILALQIYRFSYISQSSYLVLLRIVIFTAYVEFASIVIYEASKCALAHSQKLRDIVYKCIGKETQSQLEILPPEHTEDQQGLGEHEDLQEELLRTVYS